MSSKLTRQIEKSPKDNFTATLKRLLSLTNASQKELAIELGLTRQYLNALVSGSRKPSLQVVKAVHLMLERVGGVSPAPSASSASGWRQVPVVSWVQAGQAVNFEELQEFIDEMVPAPTNDENAFGLIVRGDSMEPEFRDGDRIVCSPNVAFRNGCYAVARFRGDAGATFKRCFRVGEHAERLRFVPVNEAYKPMEVPASEVMWVYPVIWSGRKIAA